MARKHRRQPQQPYPYNYYGPPPYVPQRPSQPYVSVQRERGLGGLSHTAHLVLTICTCGLWLFVWIGHEIFRLLVPKKTKTKHYYR